MYRILGLQAFPILFCFLTKLGTFLHLNIYLVLYMGVESKGTNLI